MIDRLTNDAALSLAFPSTTEGKIVLALTWAPTVVVGLVLGMALLILVFRRPPPGDDEEGRAPAWFRALRAAMFTALMQALMTGIYILVQSDVFTQPDLTAQYIPRGIVLAAALAGLLVFFPDPHNSARVLARGRARLIGPFQTPVIGLLAPIEERVCTAYGRMTGPFWLLALPSGAAVVALYLLMRLSHPLNLWPLVLPFLLCWGVALLAFLVVNAALRRLNHRSLTVYCQELAALGRKWIDAVDGELRLEGLGLYQRLADLADALGKDRLLQQGIAEVTEAVAEARLALAQASLEPGGEGIKMATEYLAGALELRDLKRGEWLGLGWLLASDYVPASLLRDRARYGHFLLNYCRAWTAAQRQLRQNTPLSAGMRMNTRLGLVVTALERRACSLAPGEAEKQQGKADVEGQAAKNEKAPWRADTFLADLAARPDVQLLLALNEAMLQLDATLPWARVNAGLCRLALGDAAAARAHLEVASTQWRDDPSLPFYRAVAYAREQQSSEALALLEEVTGAELGWFLAVRTYAETLLEVSKTPLASTTTSLPGQAVNMERWQRALALIERALVQDSMQARLQTPAAAPLYVTAGMAELFGHQQPAQADLWFRRALGVDQQNALAWYGLALACWEQGDMDAALNAAQEAMRYQPQHVPAATLCAQVLMVRGEMALALAMADQTLRLLSDPRVAQMRVVHYPRLTPEQNVLLRVKGRAAFELGHFDEALTALDQVVQRYVDARFFAACALYHLRHYAQATERLKDYLASKEGARDSRAFLYLGCALHAQGQQNQRAALNALDSCLELAQPGTPEHLRGLLERGQIYEERSQFDLAQRDYETALKVERAPLTLYILAALYHRTGQDQQAYALLAPAIGEEKRMEPKSQEADGLSTPLLPAGGVGEGQGSGTIALIQINEPVEAQMRHLFEILRERLAEAGQDAIDGAKTLVPASDQSDHVQSAPDVEVRPE
jgi:tetratricopeptide (TPR) repeat protein